jgi:hypothetical protein
MPKPLKIDPCGIQLLHEPDGVIFSAFVEVKQNHKIEDGAIVRITRNGVCVAGTLRNYSWTSRPINLATDLSQGSKTNRYFLKLTLTLRIENTGVACDLKIITPPGPGNVTVTITNAPGTGNPQPSDPEEADPIYFP